MPSTEAPTEAPPAATDNSGDRGIQTTPPVSENVAAENVPGKGVGNPDTIDFSVENQKLVDQNLLNDVSFYDSANDNVDKVDNKVDPSKDAPMSDERRREIDSVKSRVNDSTVNAMDPKQQDQFYGNAIDSARNLTAANPEDRQKMYDGAFQSVPPDQRETFNRAIGAALHDQGSNLRVVNAPPVGLLVEGGAPGGDKIAGRTAIVGIPGEFQQDQKALESAPQVRETIRTALSDVPADKQQTVGDSIGGVLATQEKHGLLAPIKDVGARERPADLASPEAQAAKLKSQLSPQSGTEPIVNAAVDAANNIAFAKPEDMNRLFNAGMENLRAAGLDPSAAAGVLGQALNNVSKDLSISSDSGQVDQSFLQDKRLATPANPQGTIGVADRQTAPGDAEANHAVFTKAADVATSIRSTNTEALGRNPSESAVRDHVDRVFRVLRYY